VSSQTLFDAFKRIEALHGTKTFRWQVTASQYRPNQRGNQTHHLFILCISSSRIIAFVLMQKPLEVIRVSDFPNTIYQVPFLSCGMGLGFRVLPPFDAGHVDCICFFLKQMWDSEISV
jgi:hypothetical protein